MPRAAPLLLTLWTALLACEEERPPPGRELDGQVVREGGVSPPPRRDAGPRPPMDGGDGGDDGGPRDGGAVPVVVDGVIGADEWAGATLFTSAVRGDGAFEGDALRSLRALRDGVRVSVALEGTLTAGHAIVMYVDRALGGEDGVVSPTQLEDLNGALDRALSRELFTAAELRVDVAWGTLDMNRTVLGTDARMGWRDLAANPAAFSAIAGATACRASACEASATLAALGVRAKDDVALFVRLVDADTVAMSNQTLPFDDTLAPETVSVSVVLEGR